jgi:hypothetical protein
MRVILYKFNLIYSFSSLFWISLIRGLYYASLILFSLEFPFPHLTSLNIAHVLIFLLVKYITSDIRALS